MALEVSDRLQGSHCAAPGVSRQHWGLRVLGSGGSREPQGLRVLQVSYSGPGISGQLDTEVSMRLQGSQGSPGVSQCLGLGSHGAYWGLTMVLGISGQLDAEGSGWPQGSQGSPGVSQCLDLGSQVAVGSYNGPGDLRAAGH